MCYETKWSTHSCIGKDHYRIRAQCITYLQLSSRHCKSLSLSHKPCQLLATSRWVTYCTCEAGHPDCHAKGNAQCNSHCLEPLYTYVNGGS